MRADLRKDSVVVEHEDAHVKQPLNASSNLAPSDFCSNKQGMHVTRKSTCSPDCCECDCHFQLGGCACVCQDCSRKNPSSQSSELYLKSKQNDAQSCRKVHSAISTSEDTSQSSKDNLVGNLSEIVPSEEVVSNQERGGKSTDLTSDSESTTALPKHSLNCIACLLKSRAVSKPLDKDSALDGNSEHFEPVSEGDKLPTTHCANCKQENESCNCGIQRINIRRGGMS